MKYISKPVTLVVAASLVGAVSLASAQEISGGGAPFRLVALQGLLRGLHLGPANRLWCVV